MSVRQVLSRWYPLIILALFIIAGSIYGSKVEHHKSTFLNFGLGMLFLPTVAIAISCSENKLGLLKWLGVVYVLMVLTILIEMPITKATHHEEIFVAVPLGLYFLSAVKPKFWEILIGLALVGVCGFSVKNTTFIMMVAVLMLATFLWIFRFMRMRDKLKATFVSLLAMVLSGGLVAAAALVWYKYKDKLPHGNTEYRAEMYRIAWGKFIKSPIWGNGFTGETVSYFGLYKVDMATSYLPTHSDIIDIMANGGAIGLFLWFVAVMNVLFFLVTAFSKLSKRTSLLHEERWRWLFVAATYSLCAVITYAVNPPLINPVHGYWIWGGLGVTWVLWHDLTKTELARVRK
jgi:O-antigen ligase